MTNLLSSWKIQHSMRTCKGVADPIKRIELTTTASTIWTWALQQRHFLVNYPGWLGLSEIPHAETCHLNSLFPDSWQHQYQECLWNGRRIGEFGMMWVGWYHCVLILHANIPQKSQQQMKKPRLQGTYKSTSPEDGTLFGNLAQIELVESALGEGGFVRLAQVSLTSVWQHNISESWLIFSFSCFSLSRMPRLIVRPKC